MTFQPPDYLRSWAEIDLDALRANLAFVRRRIAPTCGILAVVKANGYGHGTREVVRALAPDTEIFGVANISEAKEVQLTGAGRDIMLLSPCLPGERSEAVNAGYIVTISTAAEAAEYATHGHLKVNFKIDTGMGRVGCWHESAMEELKRLVDVPSLTLHSISTHLPSADDDEIFTAQQLASFAELLVPLRRIAPIARIHSLNSAGILTSPGHGADLVRPGLILYGVAPVSPWNQELKPVLAWKSRVVLTKDLPAGAGVSYGRTYVAKSHLRTAVIAVGYADGFPRQASGNGAAVLIHGKRCPVIGRVTMDQIIVDISALEGVCVGDEVVIIGKQREESITASDLAAQAGTIPWDILTGIGRRVERFYPGSTSC
jgi:alanine racemase